MGRVDEHGIGAPYELDPAAIRAYRERGFVHLDRALTPQIVERYRGEITRHVEPLAARRPPIDERSLYDRAFVQVTNLWTRARQGARDGKAPRANRSITAWIPLQDTPLEMGPLAFAAGSFRLHEGRDLEIGEDSERVLQRTLRDFPVHREPFALGDVSFHSGGTFHRAGPNATDRPREVMTIIYIDVDMRLAEPANENQRIDWRAWCPDVKVGAIIDAPLTPVVYVEAG